MKLTKSQERIIEKIKSKYYNVEVTNDVCVIVKFDNNESLWNKITAMVVIGERGSVKFLFCDRVLCDKKHKKVLARLIASELNIKRITFAKHF